MNDHTSTKNLPFITIHISNINTPPMVFIGPSSGVRGGFWTNGRHSLLLYVVTDIIVAWF